MARRWEGHDGWSARASCDGRLPEGSSIVRAAAVKGVLSHVAKDAAGIGSRPRETGDMDMHGPRLETCCGVFMHILLYFIIRIGPESTSPMLFSQRALVNNDIIAVEFILH